MEQKDNEQLRTVIYPLQIPLEPRIRFVSETDPEVYQRYGNQGEAAHEEKMAEEEETPEPVQSELHQTAEILCKLSDSPTVHTSPTVDPLRFLTEATRYTIHPVYPSVSFANGQGIISYPLPYHTFLAQPYPPPLPPTRTGAAITTLELTPLMSEEEWVALTAPNPPSQLNIRTRGSPVVEEFLQTYLPPDTPAEDRQGWYEFLCEDGGSEDCWTKFLGNDSGAEFHHQWLEDPGYQEGYQSNV